MSEVPVYYGSKPTCPPCAPFREGVVGLGAAERAGRTWAALCKGGGQGVEGERRSS